MILLVLLAVRLALSAKVPALPLPSYVERACSRNDPDINNCIVEVGNKALKSVTQGDRKYHIPNLDPFVIPEIKITQGTKQVGLTFVCKNCAMTGLKNAVFKKVDAHMKEGNAEWSFFIENLNLSGKYNATGKVLLLPIQGRGISDINMEKINFSFYFTWELIKKANNLEYAKVKDYSLKYDIGGLTIFLENLFNGDKILGNTMNTFLNENWKELVRELGPPVAEALGQVFLNSLNAMSDLIPYDTLFPA